VLRSAAKREHDRLGFPIAPPTSNVMQPDICSKLFDKINFELLSHRTVLVSTLPITFLVC
jgi:hypothetical protein